MARKVEGPMWVPRGAVPYPSTLSRLGKAAPGSVALYGNQALLHDSILGVFCSVRIPGTAIIQAYDLARELGSSGHTVAGGFQSPMERELLDYLLTGSASVIICPARGLNGMRIPVTWRPAMNESRLLLLSSFPEIQRRPTLTTADHRNRVVAAIATRLMILHASSGGRLARLARDALNWGIPVHCLDHPANEDLRTMGVDCTRLGLGLPA